MNVKSCYYILRGSSQDNDDFNQARRYNKSNLLNPSSFLNYLTQAALPVIFYQLPRICNKVHLAKTLRETILKHLNFMPMKCSKHQDLDERISKVFVNCALYFWTKRINLIMKGKDSKFVKFMSTNTNLSLIDPVKILAHNSYLKKRLRRAKLNQ